MSGPHEFDVVPPQMEDGMGCCGPAFIGAVLVFGIIGGACAFFIWLLVEMVK